MCDSFVDFFKNEDIKRDVKKIIRPIGALLYNELYIYIWFICIYHVFFLFILLANFFLLSKLLYNVEKLRISRIIQMHGDAILS